MKKLILIPIVTAAVAFLLPAQHDDTQAEGDFLAHNQLIAGPELYRLYCASCHGVDGRGDGAVAEALKHKPSDLTLIARRHKGEFPAFRITHIIDGYEVRFAHGTREMPVWGRFFGDMTRNDELLKLREHNLTEYIRSIQR